LIKYNRNWSNRAEEEDRCVANRIAPSKVT
jgi:hypothetical protein